jgi:hypothetical protein
MRNPFRLIDENRRPERSRGHTELQCEDTRHVPEVQFAGAHNLAYPDARTNNVRQRTDFPNGPGNNPDVPADRLSSL